MRSDADLQADDEEGRADHYTAALEALDQAKADWQEELADRDHWLHRERAAASEEARREAQDRDGCESIEAITSYWDGVMRRSPVVRYRDERLGIDTRMFGP